MFAPPYAATGGTIAAALPPAGPDVVIPPQEFAEAAVPAAPVPVVPAPVAPVAPVQLVPAQPTAANPPQWPPPVLPHPPPDALARGWAPPPEWLPPVGSPAVAPPDPAAEGRLLSGRALIIVAVSIGLGALYQGAVKWMNDDPHIGLGDLVRWNIVLNIVLYAVVAALVISQITPKVRLRWGEQSWPHRVAFGVAIGAACGLLGVAVNSATNHGLATDPRVVQLMSSGDVTHIVITVLLVAVAAPLVEETLFRGLLLESLRRYGVPLAIFVSAVCFAIWHLREVELIYYTLMGAVLGAIYVKRGLLSSMCAHAAFNATLTMVGIIIVLGPAHHYHVGDLQITAPGGWTTEQTRDFLDSRPEGVILAGPDAAQAALLDLGEPTTPFDPEQSAERLQQLGTSLPAGSSIDAGSVRELSLPTVGTAVEVNVTIHSSAGQMAFFAYQGEDYLMFAVTGDSSKAQSDFTKMLDSLQPA
jgi:membrane protease YdiL (CAAX protease family)